MGFPKWTSSAQPPQDSARLFPHRAPHPGVALRKRQGVSLSGGAQMRRTPRCCSGLSLHVLPLQETGVIRPPPLRALRRRKWGGLWEALSRRWVTGCSSQTGQLSRAWREVGVGGRRNLTELSQAHPSLSSSLPPQDEILPPPLIASPVIKFLQQPFKAGAIITPFCR